MNDEFTEGEAVALTIIYSDSRTYYIGVDQSSSKIKKYQITVFSDNNGKDYKKHNIEVINNKSDTKKRYESLVDEYLQIIDRQKTVKRFISDKF